MYSIPLSTYEISVARGLLDSVGEMAKRVAPAHRYAIITDSTVERLCAPNVRTSLGGTASATFSFPAGESAKTRETWMRLTDAMLASGFGRDTTVIALGGGVVGDVAGFVAATFMRGVPYVQVPTTLLAMIDSSIGGKTGVDTDSGKNLVGAFHQPAAVVIDPGVLATLPLRELRSGMAEAIKHGVIADADYFEQIVEEAPRILSAQGALHAAMDSLIARSIEIKAEVVRRDERETGQRRTLNFGHTIGHALEAACDYSLLHGEAVAIGMVLESELAERARIAELGTAGRVREAVGTVGLGTTLPSEVSVERLIAATRGDKKARGGETRFALPRRIGAMAGESDGWTVRLDEDLLREVLVAS